MRYTTVSRCAHRAADSCCTRTAVVSRCARIAAVSCCALAAAALLALHVPTQSARAQEPAAGANRIAAALDEPSRADFVDMPLATVADFYRDLLGIPILIDHPALDEMGLSPDHPVTLALDNTRFETVLDLLLRPLDLTWAIYDNVLLITSPDRAEEMLTVEVYPLGNLSDALLAQGVSIDALIDAIQTNIRPQSWDVVGGVASISVLGDVLVVSQTPGTHREVARLLGQLQEKMPATAAARRPAQGDAAAEEPHRRHVDRVRGALAGPIDLDMLEVPLQDVAGYIADFAGIEVLLDVPALAADGVSADTPITLSLSNVRLSTALTLLLDPLSLDYAVEDDVLLVTTRQRAEGPLARMAVYDVSTMAADQTEAMAIAQSVAAASQWQFHFAGGGFGGTGVMVAPPTSVTAVRQSLVVRASERQHERIGRLLTDLARATYRQRPTAGHVLGGGHSAGLGSCDQGSCETGACEASNTPGENAPPASGPGATGGIGGGAFGGGASGRGRGFGGGGFGGGLH